MAVLPGNRKRELPIVWKWGLSHEIGSKPELRSGVWFWYNSAMKHSLALLTALLLAPPAEVTRKQGRLI
jgi:hypothetical protein